MEPVELSRYSYGLDDRGSISGSGKRSFFHSQRPDRRWGPPIQ
jgi:hypothetical protein